MTTVTESESTADERAQTPLRIRYRIRFAKQGLLRWISHRDLARLWERLVRRAELKLSMTEGFHPKPRIGFPSALALGVEGLDEVVELELAEHLQPADLLDRLRRDEQPGLGILSVARLPEGFGKAQLLRSDYTVTMPPAVDLDALSRSIDNFKTQTTVSVARKKKNKTITVDVAAQVETLEISGNELKLSLAASESASLRPTDVLDLIGAGHWIEDGASIKRVRVLLEREVDHRDADTSAQITDSETEQTPGD
jgi:radical SAM-linked protein